MKSLNGVTLLLLCSAVMSCSKNERAVYEASKFSDVSTVEFELVTEDLRCRVPRDINVNDKYLVLSMAMDAENNKCWIYERSTMEKVYSGIKHGRGPKEVVFGHANAILDGDTMSYYDIMSHKVVSFPVDSVVTYGMSVVKEEELDVPAWAAYMFHRDDKLVVFNNVGYMSQDTAYVARLQIRDKDGGIVDSYNRFPVNDKKLHFALYHQMPVTVSPDKTKMAIGCCTYGAIMELYSLVNGIEEITTKYFLEPKGHDSNGDYVMDDDTVYGFADFYSTDSLIFTSYDGESEWREVRDMGGIDSVYHSIAVFDWEGNPVKLIRTNLCILSLCYYEKEDTVYAIVRKDGSEYIGRLRNVMGKN